MRKPRHSTKKAHRSEPLWRRAWDLNPRRFPLPVFKTGALGRYASPPWANLPVGGLSLKTGPRFMRGLSPAFGLLEGGDDIDQDLVVNFMGQARDDRGADKLAVGIEREAAAADR